MASRLHIDLSVPFEDLTVSLTETLSLTGVTALFGPSGAGKSTLLRAIAGLLDEVRGQICFDDEVWFDTGARINRRPHRRPVGFVFQDRRLFPHLSVAGNLGFAAKRRDRTTGEITRENVIDAFDLAPLLARDPATLSGGESQRVALACALLTGPKLLLLDEPLSALDQASKARILPYIGQIYERFGIPSLYVSHAVEEVVALADEALILVGGKCQAYGSTTSTLGALDRHYFNTARDASVVLPGRVAGHDAGNHLTAFDLGGQTVFAPLQGNLPIGRAMGVRIRADDVSIATERPSAISIRNILEGQLLAIRPDEVGAFTEVDVQLAGGVVRARLTKAAVGALGLVPGQTVFALIKAVSLDPPLS